MGEIVSKRADGIIYAKYKPIMDKEAAQLFVDELKREIDASTGKVRVLTDGGSGSGIPTGEAKALITEGIKGHRDKIEKSAVVIDSAVKRLMVKAILFTSGRSDITVFGTVDEALEWLKA